MLDFESFVANVIKENFARIDEDAADAREKQGIAQTGLGNRVITNKPIKEEELEPAKTPVSTATRVLNDMSDPLYYQPDEFPTQEVRVDRAPRFSNVNRSTVLDILSANRDGLEKQGIVKMPMGMMRKPDPTLDIDSLQSRLLDRLDLRPPEGSPQDIQYGAELGKLGRFRDDYTSIDVDRDAPAGGAQENQPNVDDVDEGRFTRKGLGSFKAIKTGMEEADPNLVEGMTFGKLKKDFVIGYLAGHEGIDPHKSIEGGKDTAAYGIKESLGIERGNYKSGSEGDKDFAAAVALKHYETAERKFKAPILDKYGKNTNVSDVWDDLGEAGRYALTDLHFNTGTVGDSAKASNAKDAITNTLNFINMTTKDKKTKGSLFSLAKRRALNWNKAADELGLTKIDKIQQMPRAGGGTIMNYLDAEGNVVHKVSNGRKPIKVTNNKGDYKILTTTREEEI